MKIKNLGPFYKHQLQKIQDLASRPSYWQDDAVATLERAKTNFKNTDALLQVLHEMQRLDKVIVAKLEGSAAFREAIIDHEPPMWNKFSSPPVSEELQHSLADKMYSVVPGQNDFAFVDLDNQSRVIGPVLFDRLTKDKIPFILNFVDPDFNALLINHGNDASAHALGEVVVDMAASANKRIMVYSGTEDKPGIEADPAKMRIRVAAQKELSTRTSSGDLFYTLTIIPTRKDAEIDGIAYDDYLKLFFEMCDQPWDRISTAQQALIREFNAASTVRITNDDGTDVSMSLIDHDGSHFTFCNSLIAKNVPGSEIFSAPRRDSVNGVVVAKGRFGDGGEIENLTMEFNDGELVRYSAEKGLDEFTKAVTMDDGARYVGELGIGTNPHLKQHVCNGLLVEKIGGSFHLALGRPYSYTEYGGEPVKVDNGGQSGLHWDITTMLYGKNGKIYLDDIMVMDNGLWIDPQYDVLNRGWESVEEDQRPDYWKDFYKNQAPANTPS